jgi:hypothetical protein
LSGSVYPYSKITASTLEQDDVIGTVQGSCTMAGNNQKDHFCTYEVVVYTDPTDGDGNTEGFGTVVATGSLGFAEEDGGFLMIESTQDDFSDSSGGVLKVTYLSVEDPIAIEGTLMLR